MRRTHRRVWHALVWLTLSFTGMAQAAADPVALREQFREVRPQLRSDSPFDAPLWVRSETEGHRLTAEVFSLLPHPFEALDQALGTPARWCQFIPLNLNVKSCVYDDVQEPVRLSLYVGHKEYERPENAYRMDYRYRIHERTADYLKVSMEAPQGPWGTHDYRIVVEALRLDARTLVRVHSAYSSSWRSRLATSAYLSTLGRDKVGFTMVGRDAAGNPEFVKGVKGIIERNVMRNYLSLEAFLKTRNLPANGRFEARIHAWYRLTERYARQLRELEQDAYLKAKRRERSDQIRLQAQVGGRREAVASN